MKKLLHELKTGISELTDIPAPELVAGTLLVASARSVNSPGTERMLKEFDRANWRQQSDQKAMVSLWRGISTGLPK